MSDEKTAARVVIHGRVQGVGFRFFAQDLAEPLGLRGWVRNRPDGKVEAYVEGPRAVIEVWAHRLEKGPVMSRVEFVSVEWFPPENNYDSFCIIS